MKLVFVDLRGIVNKSKEALPSNIDPRVKNEYQRPVNKAISIIPFNLVDNQLAHIKSCKGPKEEWETLCNIHKMKSVVQYSLCLLQCFYMQDARMWWLIRLHQQGLGTCETTCLLGGTYENEEFVMTLLKSLSPSYTYLIITLETISMMELTMKYVMIQLIHKILKKKK